MQTTVTIQSGEISIAFGGITLMVGRDEISESLSTIEDFIINIWPENHKDNLDDLGINQVFSMIRDYEPLVQRLIDCYKVEATSMSRITINDDGTVDLWSNEHNVNVNIKELMQVIADFEAMLNNDTISDSEPQ